MAKLSKLATSIQRGLYCSICAKICVARDRDGAKSATRRAHEIYQRLLADYEPPPMAPEIAEELDAFVARRIEEGGAIPED